MSNPLRIALVAEGTTEFEVIQAALQAILSPRSFVLTKLQPEETKPEMGDRTIAEFFCSCDEHYLARCNVDAVL